MITTWPVVSACRLTADADAVQVEVGPPPTPAPEPVRVERRVSSRGSLSVAGQRIHVGIAHAGRTLTIESAHHTFRVYDEDTVLICETARTTVRAIARFKVRKPESGRRAAGPTAAPAT